MGTCGDAGYDVDISHCSVSMHKIEPLTPTDKSALKRELDLGVRILYLYLHETHNSDFGTIDKVLDLWFRDTTPSKPQANDISLGLGSLVGEQLCEIYKCRWVVVTDTFGCDLGVLNDANAMELFPRHWIAKRLDPQNAGSSVIANLVSTLEHDGILSK